MGLFDSLKGALGKGTVPAAQPAKPKTLEEQRQELEEQLKLAEAKWRRHEIDELTFRQLSEENQRKMVGIEAQIEVEKDAARVEGMVRGKTSGLGPPYAAKLGALLREKARLEKTGEIANRKYLKRVLREETYLNISRELKKKIIEFEAQINLVYREAAREIMVETQAELARAGVEDSPMDIEKAAEEIAEQVPRKRAEWPAGGGQAGPRLEAEGPATDEANEQKLPRRLRKRH